MAWTISTWKFNLKLWPIFENTKQRRQSYPDPSRERESEPRKLAFSTKNFKKNFWDQSKTEKLLPQVVGSSTFSLRPARPDGKSTGKPHNFVTIVMFEFGENV